MLKFFQLVLLEQELVPLLCRHLLSLVGYGQWAHDFYHEAAREVTTHQA
jgi:hypothetical protein